MGLELKRLHPQLLSLACLGIAACGPRGSVTEDEVVDEPMASGLNAYAFAQTDVDYFHGIDANVELDSDELKGRNTWMLWTAGNQAFWDHIARHTYGLTDLLKTIDSRKRGSRFRDMGVISDPDTIKATHPDEHGLWIDEAADPRGPQPDPGVYGRSSGIVGLRLFPNPEFDEAARKRWDAKSYDEDEGYYNNPNLVRPYRVGMTCAFCHVSFHPLHPPVNPEEPKWSELSATIGAQYFRVSAVFGSQLQKSNFIYQLLESARPGTVDTSFLVTDGINNPTAIGPLFELPARLARAEQNPLEGMGYSATMALPPRNLAERQVPHLLMDGGDSVGLAGAIHRTYANIGEFHQYSLKLHDLLVGVKAQRPFDPEFAARNSVYWQATEDRIDNLIKYLLKATPSLKLKDAPGGAAYITKDPKLLRRGKIVFAENCMGCHSSKQPASGEPRKPEDYEIWSRSPAYLRWARSEVLKPDFEVGNFFSTDQRYPLSLIQTNAARALATNATSGHIWEAFSSESYKGSPTVAPVNYADPFSGEAKTFVLPAGGLGYYRAPSLIGIWATAPFLHNNSVGEAATDPSVRGRVAAFQDAIEKLLFPDKRIATPQAWKDHGQIIKTQGETYLRIPARYLGDLAMQLTGSWARGFLIYPWLLSAVVLVCGLLLLAITARARKLVRATVIGLTLVLALGFYVVSSKFAGKLGDFELGPIPAGVPVYLFANINLEVDPRVLATVFMEVREDIAGSGATGLEQATPTKQMQQKAVSDLLGINRCPDLVEDRGHEFGSMLPDPDKRALIEYLKTL